jgi:hypothetical protein
MEGVERVEVNPLPYIPIAKDIREEVQNWLGIGIRG